MLPFFCATSMFKRIFSMTLVYPGRVSRPGDPPSKPEDLLDVLPAEATCLTAFAEAAEVEEALKSLEL